MAAFQTTDFESQYQRSLGKASSGYAEVGECVAVARRITDGDTDSWHREWFALAEDLKKKADSCLERGHRVSALHLYARASEYYRQASFFHRVDLDCRELQSSWAGHRRTQRAALELGPYAWEAIAIPFDGKHLFGYVLLQDDSGRARETIICPSGYDGTTEEMIPYVAMAALERGYNLLLFDGPGQGGTLYESGNRLFMRPDFDVPLRAVVDYALTRPEFNKEKIALYGVSFGGFLVPRGATGEQRIAAIIADPGQYDIGGAMLEKLPDTLREQLYNEGAEADAAFDVLISTLSGKLLFEPRMSAHGARSVREYITMLQEYTITPEQATAISCPTLICDNETDLISTGQGKKLASMLACPHEFARFTEAEGAGGHTELIGRQILFQRVFDWLDELFERNRTRK